MEKELGMGNDRYILIDIDNSDEAVIQNLKDAGCWFFL